MALDGWVKQSTAVTVKIGPFVDSVDGNTDEPGLTISQADVRLSKNGANIAQKTEATSCTYDEIGYYDCPLDATDTGTLGLLKLMVHEAGALHVTHTYMVVPANVWDSLFGADLLQVDMTQIAGAAVNTALAQIGVDIVKVDGSALGAHWAGVMPADVRYISGDGPAADNLEAACDGGAYNVGGGAVVAASVTGAVGSVTGAVGSVTGAVGSVAGNVDGNVTGSIGSLGAQAKLDVNAEVDTALNTAIPGVPTANSVNERVAALDDHITADYGATEKAAIDLLDDVAGGLADIHTDVAAVKTDTAAILLDTAEIGAAGAGLTAVPWNAAWDAEAQSECADALVAYDPPTNAEMEARTLLAASYFDPAVDVVASVTTVGSVTGAVGSVTGAVGSVTGAVGSVAGAVGSVTGAVGSVAGNVDGNVTGSIGSLAAQAKADVNAEVDSALNTAIPGTPTANSVNERMVALDDHITADYGATEKAAIDLLDDVAGGLVDIHTDVAAVKTDTAAILVDTGTTLDTKIDTIDDFLDTEIAAIKAKTDLIPAAPAQAGEATAALAAYDPPTKAELDAAVSTIRGADNDTLKTLSDQIDNVTLVGPGAHYDFYLVTEDDGVTPIQGVGVWVSTDSPGSNVVAGTIYTASNGRAYFMLDEGTTYYFWRRKDGYTFSDPDTEVW